MINYESMTKAQLQAEIGRLESELQEKDYNIRHLTDQITKNLKDSEGWLITCPNPLYDGTAFDLRFVAGQLFLQKDRPVAHFIHEPTKESTMKKLGYTQEQVSAVREREANWNPAEQAAHAFQNDFGYQVEYFTAERADELKKRMAARATEASKAAEAESRRLEQERQFGGSSRI